MLNVLLTCLVSFTITFIAIPAIMRVADEKKLYDLPDARKLHTKAIASLGGVGIFIGFFLAALLTLRVNSIPELQYFFAAGIVTFFLGLKDDILILSATKKFLGQLAAAAIIIHLADIRISSMHGIFGIYEIPALLGILLSYITIIVIINAFNLIDGVDGLSGSLGVLTTSLFGVYFLLADMPSFALLAFGLSFSLIAFLIYNYHPAKIFMGDSGSLVLGLMNAIFVLKFMSVADAASARVPVTSVVAIGFSILIVPLLDTLRVFTIRIFNGRSPFSPDRNHIHHLLLDRGFSHSQVTLTCVGVNTAFVALAYFGRSLGSTLLLVVMLAAAFGLIGLLFYLRKPAPRLVVARSYKATTQSTTKVVALTSETVAAEQQG